MKKNSSKKVPTPFSLGQIAHRLFPLGPIPVLVALTACCYIEPGTRIVFNTLAPDCNYDRNRAWIISSERSGPYSPYIDEIAAKFTAMSSGNLAIVYLGLTTMKIDYAGAVSVFLYSDAAGWPDNATQTYLGPKALAGIGQLPDTVSDRCIWENDLNKTPPNIRGPAANIARLLKPFGIKARVIKMPDDSTARGYLREDFEDSWNRYCPLPPKKT